MAHTRRTDDIFDVDLELRDVADGAETSTANETAIAFDVLNVEEYKAVFYVTAMDFATTDETYVFDISVSDTSGGTYTKIATLPDIGSADGTGKYEVALSGALAQGLDSDAAFIRCGATLGGTTPSITYGCYLTKV
jgi:hypothetical protein